MSHGGAKFIAMEGQRGSDCLGRGGALLGEQHEGDRDIHGNHGEQNVIHISPRSKGLLIPYPYDNPGAQ